MSVGAWRPLPLALASPVLAEILDGGQSFRWNRLAGSPEIWRGVFGRHGVELATPSEDGTLRWRALTTATNECDLLTYLGETPDLATATDALPWRSDPILARAMQAFPGLRILRQDLDETLMAFICSSTKRIVQIKEIVALLAREFGSEILPGLHAMPAWSQLAAAGEAALRACKLGYRARYLAQTAEILDAQPTWKAELDALPYTEARDWLVRLPGVGEKVADCVSLFGAGRLEAFPVDTWIVQAMSQWYGLEGWNPRQIAHFGRTHFGKAAGLAQQYLFAAARRGVTLA